MRWKIESRPSYSLLELSLDAGERVVSEAGAMAWMDPGLEVETSTRGGLLSGLKRKLLAGETLFQNTYTARQAGRLALAPGAAGDIEALELDGELHLERGAYLAHAGEIAIDSKFQGLSGLFKEGLFALRVQGRGLLFFDAYGALQRIEVDGSYVVDNGYAVAWDPSLRFQLTRARRVRSFLFSDQLLMRFEGRGSIWIQNRSTPGFANWVHPFRRVERRKNSGD
ncbi:MAG: TIGR00266 family protein [Planctomycetota bacterium]